MVETLLHKTRTHRTINASQLHSPFHPNALTPHLPLPPLPLIAIPHATRLFRGGNPELQFPFHSRPRSVIPERNNNGRRFRDIASQGGFPRTFDRAALSKGRPNFARLAHGRAVFGEGPECGMSVRGMPAKLNSVCAGGRGWLGRCCERCRLREGRWVCWNGDILDVSPIKINDTAKSLVRERKTPFIVNVCTSEIAFLNICFGLCDMNRKLTFWAICFNSILFSINPLYK